jgi:hypothetical protein
MRIIGLRIDLLLAFCEAVAVAACAGSTNPASSGSVTTGSTGTSGASGMASGAVASTGTSSGTVAGTGAGSATGTGTGSGAGTGSAAGSGISSGSVTTSGASAGTGASSGQTSGSAQSGSGSSGVPGNDAGPSDASLGGDGPIAVAGCANNNYPLCLDFENGIDTTVWTGGTPAFITTADFAHGGHSYLLYAKSDAGKVLPSGGTMTITKLGTITNQLWGRFYVHFKPGLCPSSGCSAAAPYGHGNILGAYDPANNWYEIGYQLNGVLGDYHWVGGERSIRGKPPLVDQWYCIESFFDGSTANNMPVWWVDGQVPQYYMEDPSTHIPAMLQQFVKITIGNTPYAALGLDPPYGSAGPPWLSEMYIDDIAFDTKRIGCIP